MHLGGGRLQRTMRGPTGASGPAPVLRLRSSRSALCVSTYAHARICERAGVEGEGGKRTLLSRSACTTCARLASFPSIDVNHLSAPVSTQHAGRRAHTSDSPAPVLRTRALLDHPRDERGLPAWGDHLHVRARAHLSPSSNISLSMGRNKKDSGAYSIRAVLLPLGGLLHLLATAVERRVAHREVVPCAVAASR